MGRLFRWGAGNAPTLATRLGRCKSRRLPLLRWVTAGVAKEVGEDVARLLGSRQPRIEVPTRRPAKLVIEAFLGVQASSVGVASRCPPQPVEHIAAA